MRECIRCQSVMLEGFDIKVSGNPEGLVIANGKKIFADRLEDPKVAICPKCGEISLYIEKLDKLKM